MSHFAEIDENNVVIRVLVGDNSLPDEGKSWFEENLGGRWVQTSYNTRGGVHSLGGVPLRKNFAGEGYTFDEERDAFIPPRPFDSWTLNEETCNWDPPVPMPGIGFEWNEEAQTWDRINLPE